jgi:hypothetical protein
MPRIIMPPALTQVLFGDIKVGEAFFNSVGHLNIKCSAWEDRPNAICYQPEHGDVTEDLYALCDFVTPCEIEIRVNPQR